MVELSKVDLIQAAVLLHPSLVTVDDIKGLFISCIIFARFDLFLYLSYLIRNISILEYESKGRLHQIHRIRQERSETANKQQTSKEPLNANQANTKSSFFVSFPIML